MMLPLQAKQKVWTPQHETTAKVWFTVGASIVSILCFSIIVLICLRKNMQPLKKKSPQLIIASVIGNFLIILNLTVCAIYYNMVMSQ